MHNRKKLALTDEQKEDKRRKNVERAQRYAALSGAAMALNAAAQYDEAALEASARVVGANPDQATLWNFRRRALSHLHPEPAEGGSDEAAEASAAARRKACEVEFRLTQECLGANPKSYPVWFHREWVMKWGRCAWQHATDLKLTTKLLQLDERNFHCWTYRRFVVKEAGVGADAELAFTGDKIAQNFSNYSAWHLRSKLLPQIHAGSTTAAWEGTLKAELELLRNAFFTAPEDQSAWFYHRWVLGQLETSEGRDEILRAELAMVDELLELEPDAKWPLATAAFLGRALGDRPADVESRLVELKRVDPMRARYYEASLGVELGS